MIKWSFNKIVLLTLHLAVWVLLQVLITRLCNYLIPYCEDIQSMIGVWVLCGVTCYHVAKYMMRQACSIYVGVYESGGQS